MQLKIYQSYWGSTALPFGSDSEWTMEEKLAKIAEAGFDGVEYLMEEFGDDAGHYQQVRNLLGRYGLGGHAHEILLRQCSGGQKARVVMASLSLMRPHILIMDEPTNHLDIETIEALASALNAFSGGVVLVSHDARLITEAECDLWVLGDKNVELFEDGFDAYRDMLLDQIEKQRVEQEEAVKQRLAARAAEREKLLEEQRKRRS